MKNFQEKIDKIEGYLEGSLDQNGVKEVENALASDKEFQKTFESYKFLVDGIKFSGRKELHEKIKLWDNEISDDINLPTKNTKLKPFRWYAVAASIVFFAIAGIVISVNLDRGYQGVVADYYKPYDIIPPTVRGENDTQDLLESIYTYYELGKYSKVIESINQLETEQQTDLIKFLLANSYQVAGDYDAAIQLFEKLSTSDTGFKSAAQWYMALCLLSKEEAEKAIPILEELSTSNTFHESDAKSLLEDIK